MPGARIEALLASFPKLIQSNSQHTFVETDSVRYVYQPLEDLYMIVITTKNSNILQDIDTLHLLARAVSNQSHSLDEHDILLSCFEILEAFDEIVSLGYRENVSLAQVQTMLEMDSHEERIHEIIERNKELEAKEELKRRARQLEMQRRDASRRQGTSSGFGSSDGYQGIPKNYDTPAPTAPVHAMPDAPTGTPSVPFKGKGMQLGKKPKSAALLGQAKPVKITSDAAKPAQMQPRSPAIPSKHAQSTVPKPVSKPAPHAQPKQFAPNPLEKSPSKPTSAQTSSLPEPRNVDQSMSWDKVVEPNSSTDPLAEVSATEAPLRDSRSESTLIQHQDHISDPYADQLTYQDEEQDTADIQPRSPTPPESDPPMLDPYATDSASNPAMTNFDDAQRTDYDIQPADNAGSQQWDFAQGEPTESVDDPYASLQTPLQSQDPLDSPAVPLSSIVPEHHLSEDLMNHDFFPNEAQEPNPTQMNQVNGLETSTNELFDSEPLNRYADSDPFASLNQFGEAPPSIDALLSEQQEPSASVPEPPIAESTHADLLQANDQYHTEAMRPNEADLLNQSGVGLGSEPATEPSAIAAPIEIQTEETSGVPPVTEVQSMTEVPPVTEILPVPKVPSVPETPAVSEASIAPEVAREPVPTPAAASVSEEILQEKPAPSEQPTLESLHSAPSVEFLAKERVSLTSNREGGLDSMEIKGDLMLKIHDANYARLAIDVAAIDQFGNAEIQYRTHPHVDKQAWASEHRITLRDPRRPFPLNQQVGILRWRAITKDEAQRPLGISVWLSPMEEGACEVNVEYELERHDLTLSDVSIVIPIPANVEPDLAEPESGSVTFDSESSRVIWQLPTVSSMNSTASFECVVPSGAENVDCLFPVSASFSTNHTLSDVLIKEVHTTDSGSPVPFQSQAQLTTDNYLVH
ncbi:coatomer subunit delta [Malassezia psittaci]|uniref:Coatomer subunit delta n=1 Tax=Malassezia psittaci TaxID=1821823 RepID=A0AAF0JF52_9BASI|nr:coatomer subunit delta [Malassezia psittaci]